MSESKRIKTALVSVYHKDGLDAIIRRLAEEGVEFLSTGGTRHFIECLGYSCHAVEDTSSESFRWYFVPSRTGRGSSAGD